MGSFPLSSVSNKRSGRDQDIRYSLHKCQHPRCEAFTRAVGASVAKGPFLCSSPEVGNRSIALEPGFMKDFTCLDSSKPDVGPWKMPFKFLSCTPVKESMAEVRSLRIGKGASCGKLHGSEA